MKLCICSSSKAVYKSVWHIPLLCVQWINSWWWTEELSETCRVSCQNKFVKLVHLVGFIIKKFVTMHGHMNVKKKIWEYVYLKNGHCQPRSEGLQCDYWLTAYRWGKEGTGIWKQHTNLVRISERKRLFQRPTHIQNIILKWISKKHSARMWNSALWLRTGCTGGLL
jgi:hypothetical protein